jgi:uncharacterized protein (TIGR02001 family)
MKKIIGMAMLASAAVVGTTGVASAEGAFSANVALTSDYVFRGVSLTGGDPAIQGGFDYTQGIFYAGAWGSSLTSGMELDLYAGVTPTVGAVNLDFGVVGYFYPGADDDGAEFDYFEVSAAANTDLSEQFNVGANVFYSPENYGETGSALYYEANATFTASDALNFSAAIGQQQIDDVDGPGGGADLDDDYTTWNAGGTFAAHGFEVDLRYHQADIDATDPIALSGFASEDNADGRVVLTLSREL